MWQSFYGAKTELRPGINDDLFTIRAFRLILIVVSGLLSASTAQPPLFTAPQHFEAEHNKDSARTRHESSTRDESKSGRKRLAQIPQMTAT
jgi:hypothetical protein